MSAQLQNLVDKFNQLPKSVQQSIIGSSSGFATGYTLVKFGRSAGFSLGASILLLQIGHKLGYIKIDWCTMERDLQKAKEEVEKQAAVHIPEINKQVQSALKDHLLTVSSFVGGFFLGCSTA